ncbi:MAG: lytic murein transglycosylase, partial [Paracoccaceae bacterium]
MRLIFSVLATLSLSTAAYAAQCGGSFDGFVNDLKSEARDSGYSKRQVNDFFSGVAQDPKVIKA